MVVCAKVIIPTVCELGNQLVLFMQQKYRQISCIFTSQFPIYQAKENHLRHALPHNVLLVPLCGCKGEAGINRWQHVQNGLLFRNPQALFRSVLKVGAACACKLLHIMQKYWLYTTDVAFTALENKQYCIRLEHENGDASLGFAKTCLKYKLPHAYRAFTV